MPSKAPVAVPKTCRQFNEEFRREAVQMLLDGHSAQSLAERLGLSSTTLLNRWKSEQLQRSGPVASTQDGRILALEAKAFAELT